MCAETPVFVGVRWQYTTETGRRSPSSCTSSVCLVSGQCAESRIGDTLEALVPSLPRFELRRGSVH